MSAVEESITSTTSARIAQGPLDRFLALLSSVRFGIFLLIALVILSMIGMLIVQQNVQGFDSFYASLTPAEQIVFGRLGFFDIYHTWYFNALLLLLSLNIILASIDRFPTAWSYISKPKLTATPAWAKSRKYSEQSFLPEKADEAAQIISKYFQSAGFKPTVTETFIEDYAINPDGTKNFSQKISKRTLTVFGEKGKFNRIGAYLVHIALLILFLGHFVSLQTGFDADVRMVPGESTDKIQLIQFDLDKKEKFDVQIPFTIYCEDIEQKLIDPTGGIDITNTLDWRTRIRIDDPQRGTTTADVALNKPFTYRGYRFFQAQTIPVGNARQITLKLTSVADGSEQIVTVQRQGTATLPDGTVIKYDAFFPDFAFNAQGQPDTRSADYRNPVAVLSVTKPGEAPIRVFAFAAELSSQMPVGAPKAGYKWRLVDYQKAPLAHVLSIKYDPYNGAFVAWYFGGIGLIAALVFVFFTSHKRLWGVVEESENGSKVTLSGDVNRNFAAFEKTFIGVCRKIFAEK
ncbi:MAG TPA: cytochrome c biogenesis protein ResB [Pyrinomonadaceae bacterium]|jgi:cytochrome c biogenesis protein|nr:cytochrome c biogenesis protein ResB [Pyrinomonadaceae bacterium]